MNKLALKFVVVLACVAYAVAAPMPQSDAQDEVQDGNETNLSPAVNAAIGSEFEAEEEGEEGEGLESVPEVEDSESESESESESGGEGRVKRDARRRGSGRFGSFQRRKFKMGGFRKSGKHGN